MGQLLKSDMKTVMFCSLLTKPTKVLKTEMKTDSLCIVYALLWQFVFNYQGQQSWWHFLTELRNLTLSCRAMLAAQLLGSCMLIIPSSGFVRTKHLSTSSIPIPSNEIVVVDPRGLALNFGLNQVSKSWDIADIQLM